MSDGDLQVALAHLLVDDEARRCLRDEPARLQRRFGLTAEQVQVLRGLDERRLEITARAGQAKRLDFLRRGLPATLRSLELAGEHGLLHDFVRTTWAPVEPGLVSRALAEGRRFLEYLDRKVAMEPAWIRDLARLELVKVELLADADASIWARRATERAAEAATLLEPGLESFGDVEVVLGHHVRVVTLAYDVVGLSGSAQPGLPREVARSQTHVTVVKQRQWPPLMTYRTGETTAGMLRLCTRPRRTAEVVAAADSPDRRQATETLRKALLEGVLLVVGTDGHPTGGR
jgi:hypothetical protein